jgi:glutamate N-acetyltransferase/amino-acid N-acetyltransferase
VLVASTGVIGRHLPMAKVRQGIGAAVRNLGRGHDAEALRAIMTTDTREKSAVVEVRLGRKPVTVAGIIKGAGMIAPSLATMICVVTTDAALTPAALHKALKAAAGETLDAVTIDSDTSTSDTVVALASGAAGNATNNSRSSDYGKFASALHEVLGELSRAMAADGEGATRLVAVEVRGARNAREAKAAAKSVADSPLVKTAIHGQDPNWGRIAMALGKSTAKVVPEKLRIRIGPTRVFSHGQPTRFDAKAVSSYLGGKEVRIVCDLGLGKGEFTALTCDLSREYIAINADYTT